MTIDGNTQVPGLYKRRVGDALVTVINDGFLDVSFEIWRGASLADMQASMRDAFRPGAPRITVNAFMIEASGRRILVDAGGGSRTIFSMGLLLGNLAVLGLSPADFDTVLLTHIHPDHSNGLLDDAGAALFPRAEIVVSEADISFWSDPSLRDGHVPAATPYLDSADAVFAAYRGQLRPARGGEEVVPGITMLPLPGHTPGHSGFQLASSGETLVIWGDTVHVPELQIPRPIITSEYDINESLAADSRRRIFKHVAGAGLLVAGMHLHVPAFAHLVEHGDGFRLVPEPWAVAI